MTAQQANFRDEVLDEVKKIARAPVATLQGVLKPLHFDAELAQYGTRFVIGTRQWVFDDVEAWRCGESGRCRVLLAGPGFGKTAIVARLVAMQRDQVLAVHLCRHNDAEKRNPRLMIQSLAYQIAQALPAFRAVLEERLESVAASVGGGDAISVKRLLDELLLQPLSAIEKPALTAATKEGGGGDYEGRISSPLRKCHDQQK